MNRLMGLFVVVVLIGAGRSAQAQVASPYYGGFGFEYAQPPPANSYLLDRWWTVQASPMVGTTLPPRVMYEPAATPEPVNPRRATRTRMGRSLGTGAGRTYRSAAAPPTTPLPTGSLYWMGTAGVPTYSPVQRYSAYGQGYGVSPYGSADYGASYKGLYWGY